LTKYLGVMTIKKGSVIYPSSDNPRIEGLSVDDPAIQELAKSINNLGLQYRPILRKMDGKYETVDGDRRLIAVFDLLGWKEVEADVWEIDNEKEVNYMRLAANWDRVDFSALEKGSYLWRLITEMMREDGKDPERYWGHRETRNEYLTRLANEIAKPKSTVARFITMWLQIPEHQRKNIARNRDELREGKISPSKAMKITNIGRKLGTIETVWDEFVPPHEDKPATVQVKELQVIESAVRSGQIKTVRQLKKFRREKAPEWESHSFLMKRSEVELAAKLAAQLDVEFSRVIRASIFVAENHVDELREAIHSI